MTTKLDRLLESIDPARTMDEVAARVDSAVNSFHLDTWVIKHWDDFETLLARFFCHVENKILEINRPVHPEMDLGRCIRLLIDEYGPQGEKAAFEMARTGVEGGLYAVLRTIAMRMTEKYAQNEISARIQQFWDELSIDEKLAVPTEYLEKHGHLLPPELTEGSAARIRVNFRKVLEEHPRILQRTRRVGR
jgi:hypothetical protein